MSVSAAHHGLLAVSAHHRLLAVSRLAVALLVTVALLLAVASTVTLLRPAVLRLTAALLLGSLELVLDATKEAA